MKLKKQKEARNVKAKWDCAKRECKKKEHTKTMLECIILWKIRASLHLRVCSAQKPYPLPCIEHTHTQTHTHKHTRSHECCIRFSFSFGKFSCRWREKSENCNNPNTNEKKKEEMKMKEGKDTLKSIVVARTAIFSVPSPENVLRVPRNNFKKLYYRAFSCMANNAQCKIKCAREHKRKK